mgnify:CR=1 FL=1
MPTVYVTKWALTKGIFEVGGASYSDGLLSATWTNAYGELVQRCFHGEGREWHRTREAAVDRAEAMRDAKLRALEKQIARCKALKF